MVKTTMAVSVLILLVFNTASAEVREFQLPELFGRYPVSSSIAERSVQLNLPAMGVIHSVSFRSSETTAVGAVQCEGAPVLPWSTELYAYLPGDGAGSWLASEHMPEASGDFGWTSDFRAQCCSNATWDFLLDGKAHLIVYGAPLILVGICAPIGPPPTIDLTEAVLIVDAEFTVSTENSTWGAIKAAFSGG